ncbi:MAG: hypothetical protein GY862_07430 [Gammaproteobacteria bacterium]|nr:hypothetical protein [Gammaproteobacteria bacterium]
MEIRELPKRFPSTSPDCVVSYLNVAGSTAISMEFVFDQALDAKRLDDALKRTLDAEPVLGCRFVQHWRKPYWERLDKPPPALLALAENRAGYESFKIEGIDASAGPQIKACLWHSSEGDRLMLKAAHEVCDAAGCKEIAGIVSSIYTRLKHDPGCRPEPNPAGNRGLWQAMRFLPWYQYPLIYVRFQRQQWSSLFLAGTVMLPMSAGPRGDQAFVTRMFSRERTSRIVEYGRTRQATLNDLFIAAVYRALAGTASQQGQFRLVTTVDLRRYLPNRRTGQVCNLSALEYYNLGTHPGKDFAETLARVVDKTRKRKSSWIGWNDWVGLMPFFWALPDNWMRKGMTATIKLMIKRHNFMNLFTNMGPISPDVTTFDTPATYACIHPPALYPPAFSIGLTGYEGTLTLSAGVFPAAMESVSPERFLDTVLSELLKMDAEGLHSS